jgi:hypothetical protein
VVKAVVDHITDANGAWDTFYGSGREREDVLKRLNPEYQESGFALDEFQKLPEIERQATQWIATQDKELTDICDRLIAALFFFRLLDGTEEGVRKGEILCRLPADLPARGNLVKRMLQLQEDGSNLFEVDHGGRVRADVNDVQNLKDPRPNEELRLHVKLPDLPANAVGGTEIHVKMRRLVTGGQPAWLPISGSPYKI